VRWLVGLTAAVVLLASLPKTSLQRFEAVEPHMGTLVRVTVYVADEAAAREAFRTAFERIRALDRILSDYQPDSELSRLPSTAVGRAVPVSDDLFTVLEASQRLARATNGAFDVTQGPVIRLWREARRTGRPPETGALDEAAVRGGFHLLTLDPERPSVTLARPGMALDLGAIGKGYAASEAIEALTARGVRSALVAISGDLAFSAAPPGRTGWRISVHALHGALTDIPDTLELTHAAVSTSGASEQSVEIDGRRYSHVIDPASRAGLTRDITVTVVAPHGLDADGLDTAISLVGPEHGFELLEDYPGAAALVIQNRDGITDVVASPAFRALARARGVR
jgi:thiamine biosynthesis lipoprotein